MVIPKKMRLGIQVPNAGGKPPETEKTVETCCKKMKVKANPIPIKM